MSVAPVIPDHTLLRPIGRGAYGEVWLARNVMGMLRAVKVVERRLFDSDRPYEREFAGLQRYEPVSRSADGLVHVLHVGRNQAEGYFYCVMELADDAGQVFSGSVISKSVESSQHPATGSLITDYSPRTLRSDLKRLNSLPVADCLRVALDVVGGLARLHERGLVHRDVKPANIIYVDGRAKLADIGLVSRESAGRTFVGTEGYIPPEGPGSVAADIYALGMVLYEAVTGFAPEKFPKVPPEWFAEEAGPEALEFHEVVLKACDGAKERRYQSAEEMHADLAFLQSGQSVRQLRALAERVRRWRRLGWAAAICLPLAVSTALAANWRAKVAAESQAKEARLLEQARRSLARAEDAEQESRNQLRAALSEQARALVLSREAGHRTRTLEALRRAAASNNVAELRGVAFAALALPDLRLERQVQFDPLFTLALPDPAFARIAVATGDSPVNIRSLSNLAVLKTLPASTNREVHVARWSADGRFLAVCRNLDDTRSVWEMWHVDEARRIALSAPDAAYSSATFHPRHARLLIGHGKGRVVEWGLESGVEVRQFRFPDTPHALAWSADGERLAVCHREKSQWVVAVHDAVTLHRIQSFECPEPVETLAWHPGGRWLSTCASSVSAWARGVRIFEIETGTVIKLGEHRIKTAQCEFTPDGGYFVSSGWDRETIFWDLGTMRRAFSLAGTGYHHCWSANGRHFTVPSPDGSVAFYTFDPPEPRRLAATSSDALHGGQFSPDGRWLAACDDWHLCLWQLDSKCPAARVPVASRTSAFFSPDSRELFAVERRPTGQGRLRRWRLEPATNGPSPPSVLPLPAEAPKELTRAAALGHDIVMTVADGVRRVALTNAATGDGETVRIPAGQGHFSPDGRWMAVVYDFSTALRVYRMPTFAEAALLQTSNFVMSVSFSPDGDEMLVIHRSGMDWFDTATWRRTRSRPGTPVAGSHAFYTPDGSGIWAVTNFRNGTLLDRRTLEPVLPLPKGFLPLALSPDGRHLAVSVEGRNVELWSMEDLRRQLAELGLNW